MDPASAHIAERLRAELARGAHDPGAFRAALLDVPPPARDGWVDRVLGLTEIPDDGSSLPRDGVPYLPCPVDALLRVVDRAPVGPSDVFIDIGAGVGRAAALVHLLTGAEAIGIEIQPHLALAARALAARLGSAPITILEDDAARAASSLVAGSVFFLYCPFSGARLASLLDGLEPVARTRPLCICTVDLPLPPRPWLAIDGPDVSDLAVYRVARPDETA
jgi:hypothetical protein